jgi:hypothetical protein
VSFIKKGFSALGKLLTVIILAAAFTGGMVYVVFRSLQGQEVNVPEIVGKNYDQTERELEALGLKVKRRAYRYSEEAPDTILEQLPRPGDTVKTGQLILVVTAKRNPDGEEKPATIQKGNQPVEDDSEKIEELISDKPKKKAANSNTATNKKKSSTTRDVITDNSNAATSGNSNKSPADADKDAPKDKKDDSDGPSARPSAPANTSKSPAGKTPAGGGDTRPRRNP